MAEIIEFSKYRTHKSACVAATAEYADTAAPLFSEVEFGELNQIFAEAATGPVALATKKALYAEAMEEAYIEMQRPTVTADNVHELRVMVQKARDHLAEYLKSYKSH